MPDSGCRGAGICSRAGGCQSEAVGRPSALTTLIAPLLDLLLDPSPISVDAADISATLPTSWRPPDGFDVVVWNFPCVIDAGAQAGADARVRGTAELEQNRSLVGRFFTSAASLLSPDCGEVRARSTDCHMRDVCAHARCTHCPVTWGQ